MIGYVCLGTNDYDRALEFYDQLAPALGARKLWSTETMTAWGQSREQAALCVVKPWNKEPASAGNGTMFALKLDSKNRVDAAHKKALLLGACDEGGPGPRGGHGFYGAYVRDLDGNKLCFYLAAPSS
ncbi:VOC family protein [Agaribacterium haliotis]|uniref:VOC family protein n=1 Tax=Agaribacterium haliotis TaxID=2013869 RepID=UPI000BB582BD|nr:VOC family protein [Agaribacterium haliotis]